MSISSRLEAINTHLLDDYSVLTLAGADLTNVNKNIVNLKQQWQERLLYFMNNGTSVVWNNWNKVTGTGTSVSINNTVEAPMKIDLKGNTSQSGTPTPSSPQTIHTVSGDNSINVCGKNLALNDNPSTPDANYINSGAGSSAIQYDSTEQAFYTTTSRARIFKLVSGNSYVFSADTKKRTTGTLFSIYFYYFNTDTNTSSVVQSALSISSENYQRVSWSFTIPSGYNALRIIVYNGVYFKNIQVEKGNQATTYTPYTGASYPINLGSIELNKISTYQDYIFKSSGKNLCPTQVDKWEQGTIGTDGNNLSSTTRIRTIDYYPIDNDTNYYISVQNTTYCFLNIAFYNNSKTFLGNMITLNNSIDGKTSTQINIPSSTMPNVAYMRVVLKKADNTSTITANEIAAIRPMINKGTTALPYEPYGTDWYKYSAIGKVVFNGSESGWYLYSDNVFGKAQISTIRKSLCNYYKYAEDKQTAGALLNGEYCYASSSNLYALIIKNTDIETVEDFKTWLGTHNLEVYYVLNTPTYDKITDTTLISQLEAMKQSYDTQTNISQTNNDLPFELSVTALGVE